MNLTQLLVTTVGGMLLATLQTMIVRYFPHPPTQFDSTTTPADIYDFVVVGAGCGGSVVASRLSETGASVLLLETGGSAAPETVSPALVTARFIRNEEWIIPVKSQENVFLAYTNNATKLRLGKAMGGGTTVGNLIYNRGNKMDFDSWARLGNPDWDYDAVLPYFKKSEKYNDLKVPVDGHYHGTRGPLKVERKRVHNKLIEQVLLAGQQMGFSTVDPNGAHQIGFTPTFRTIDNGVRQSASESFLAPVLGRANLQIRTNALVRRVLFNRNKRAVGVEYSLDGKRRKVMARKEVILSAGVVNTPQILMLSGVGPRLHLEQHRIPVVAAVEGVGQNLQSHPIFIIGFAVKDGSVLKTSETLNIEVLREYIINQTGPVATSGTNDAYAFFNLADPSNPSWADVFIETSSGNIMTAGADFIAPIVGLNREMFGEESTLPVNQSIFALAVMLARPKSRGSVSLQSANPLETAIVDIKALAHPDDIWLHIKGIRKAFEIASMPALKNELEVKYQPAMVIPCSQLTPLTDDYWECLVRHMVYVGYDFAGTAKMAPPSDPLGVVSPRLSVRGVTGLRVVDASVMPNIPSGNPMAATYMVAEKGSDMIKQDWGYTTQPLL